MGFATELDDPLKPLRENPVSEEVIRAAFRTAGHRSLVGSGRARSIREFRPGVPIRGHRELMLCWEPPSRYSSDPLEVRSITGDVSVYRLSCVVGFRQNVLLCTGKVQREELAWEKFRSAFTTSLHTCHQEW
jgi:hypothetical protein